MKKCLLENELRKIESIAQDENYAIALQMVANLLSKYPKEYRVWTTRAYIYSRQGNSETAISDLSYAIELFAKEPDPFYSRGILFLQMGKYQEAVSDFTKVIELCDFYKSDYYREGAYFFRADAYVRLKEFEKAKLDCAHVPDNMRTWTDRLRTKSDILAECS